MSFVRGHARAVGWVVAHRRHPHGAEQDQLPLLPGARPPEEAADPPAADESPTLPSPEPVSSVRKSAITPS